MAASTSAKPSSNSLNDLARFLDKRDAKTSRMVTHRFRIKIKSLNLQLTTNQTALKTALETIAILNSRIEALNKIPDKKRIVSTSTLLRESPVTKIFHVEPTKIVSVRQVFIEKSVPPPGSRNREKSTTPYKPPLVPTVLSTPVQAGYIKILHEEPFEFSPEAYAALDELLGITPRTNVNTKTRKKRKKKKPS